MGILKGRTIIVTGGSLGIGLAVARCCAREGAGVVIAARNEDDLNTALKTLNKNGTGHHARRLDVSKREQVENFASWCDDQCSSIDGLVNCAGVMGPIGKSTQVDVDDVERTIAINFLGTFYMVHAFGPRLRSETRAKIVNYSGGGAAGPFPHFTAYAASKAAVVRLTENLAIELNDEGVDVNIVAPGFVATRLHESTLAAGPEAATSTYYEKTLSMIDSGSMPPERAAELTAFLLSAESDGITGKFISAPFDPWDEPAFQDRLRMEPDLATLRRIDDKFFTTVK